MAEAMQELRRSHNGVTEADPAELDQLFQALPPHINRAVKRLDHQGLLLEVVLDLGREPEARFPDHEVILDDTPVTLEDLEFVSTRVGSFGDDNRAGIERTLHRISAIRNRSGQIVGVTCRVGRAITGTIDIIKDMVIGGKSILLLGRPGIGKTTMLRECARVLADEMKKRVVIVDTSNEIGGDGDIPHPGIGRSRRMQVRTPALQHAVMIEAVENHMPQVIVIDEIGTELEAAAARTIAERGVQLVATAHGNSLGNLLVNPTLSDLVGGIQTVTLGDEEARRRHTQKSILERKAPPTFDVVVEQQSWQELVVHRDVADTVDSMLRGQTIVAEERTRDEETGRVTARRISSGGMEVPTWGIESFGTASRSNNYIDRSESNWSTVRRVGQQGSHSNGGGNGGEHLHARGQVRALAPTGTAPADVKRHNASGLIAVDHPLLDEGVYHSDNVKEQQPILKTLRVYPFGVSRDRLAESARQLRVPIIVTNNQDDADAIITLKNYYRRQPERLQQAEDEQKLIIILKNNTIAQMQHALARIFDIPIDVSVDENLEEAEGIHDSDSEDPTTKALLETEDAIH